MSSFDSNLIEMSVCIEISQNMFHFLQHSITIILQVACSFAHNFCSVCSIFPITPIYSLHSIMFFSHTTTTHTIPSFLQDYQKKRLLRYFPYEFHCLVSGNAWNSNYFSDVTRKRNYFAFYFKNLCSPNPYHRAVKEIDFHGFQRVIKTSKKST